MDVGVALSTAGVLVTRAITDEVAVQAAVSILLLSVALVGAVVMHSRRYGTGRIRSDYQLCLRGIDAAVGFGLSLATRMAAGVVAVVVLILTGADLDAVPSQLDAVDDSTVALVVVLVLAVFGAPFVEELFFRGLLMRSLEPRLRPAGAIAVQAVLFGLAHVGNVSWRYNLAIISSLTVAGVVLGVTAYVAKRLGPSIWLHAFFNAFAAVVMIVQHAGAVSTS